jgi:hypothetical protein
LEKVISSVFRNSESIDETSNEEEKDEEELTIFNLHAWHEEK